MKKLPKCINFAVCELHAAFACLQGSAIHLPGLCRVQTLEPLTWPLQAVHISHRENPGLVRCSIFFQRNGWTKEMMSHSLLAVEQITHLKVPLACLATQPAGCRQTCTSVRSSQEAFLVSVRVSKIHSLVPAKIGVCINLARGISDDVAGGMHGNCTHLSLTVNGALP